MLDPLTAISLASAIVQFVDFGSKIVGGTVEIYKSVNGATKENAELEDITVNINQLNDKISMPTVAIAGEAISDDESILTGLALSSKAVAKDLLTLLRDLRGARGSGSHKVWESFRMAVTAQTPWNKEKIRGLERTLKEIQEAISHRLIVMMR